MLLLNHSEEEQQHQSVHGGKCSLFPSTSPEQEELGFSLHLHFQAFFSQRSKPLVISVPSRVSLSFCLVGVPKIRGVAADVGARWRDGGELIPLPLCALFFSKAQTGDEYLDLPCLFWTDPSQGFLKLSLSVWPSMKEN